MNEVLIWKALRLIWTTVYVGGDTSPSQRQEWADIIEERRIQERALDPIDSKVDVLEGAREDEREGMLSLLAPAEAAKVRARLAERMG